MDLKMTYPKYLTKFSCIGPECSDSCCVDWTIHIDKATYYKYRNSKNKSDFNKFIMSNIRRIRKSQTDSTYGETLKSEDGRCEFLDDDDLCLIQKKLGHEYLSLTCQEYPRYYYKVDKYFYAGVHLSCPEASRLALLEKEKLEFHTGNIYINPKSKIIQFENDIKNNYLIGNYKKIFNTSIGIMQNRAYTVEKRLMILGIFINKLEKAKFNEVMSITEKFSENEFLKLYADRLNDVDSKYYTQLYTLITMSAKTDAVAKSSSSIKYSSYKMEAVDNIFDDAKDDDQALDIYINKGLYRYRDVVKEKAYILENYIVNTMFESTFPLNQENVHDIFLNYMKITVEFVMLRTTLAGILVKQADVANDTLVNIIQLHSKSMIHNRDTVNNFIDYLKNNDAYSLSGALILINI